MLMYYVYPTAIEQKAQSLTEKALISASCFRQEKDAKIQQQTLIPAAQCL